MLFTKYKAYKKAARYTKCSMIENNEHKTESGRVQVYTGTGRTIYGTAPAYNKAT